MDIYTKPESLIQRNARKRASVSRMINHVRDYDSTEGVDDASSNLVAEAANAGRQLVDTAERSEQNTELVNVREQRAESQQVEEKYLDMLDTESMETVPGEEHKLDEVTFVLLVVANNQELLCEVEEAATPVSVSSGQLGRC